MRFKVSQILRQLSKRRPLFCLEKKMGGMKTPLFYILTGLLTFGLFNSNIKAEENPRGIPIQSEKFKIIRPNNADIFVPGERITVECLYHGESPLISGVQFLVSEGQFGKKGEPPYTYEFEINKEFVGTMSIVATALAEDEKVFEDGIEIMVMTKEIPEKITLFNMPGPPFYLYLTPGHDLMINVMGTYPGNIERNITSSKTGTSYFSSNSSIFEVSSEGIIKGKQIGNATLSIINGIKRNVEIHVIEKWND